MDLNGLKSHRINAGLSVSQLAKKAKVSVHVIYRIESGEAKRPWASTIKRLSRALEVDLGSVPAPAPPQEAPVKAYCPAAKWLVVITCPKCREKFRLEVTEGEADPLESAVSCPICAFRQTISLRRAS